MSTVNRVSSALGTVITAFETDTDLATWAGVIYGGTYAFTNGSSEVAENLTLTEYVDQADFIVYSLEGIQSPLHIYVTFPSSDRGQNRAGCQEYGASFHVFGFYTGSDANKIKILDFAEACMQVLASIRDVPIEVNNVSAGILDGGRWFFNLSCRFDWRFKED